MASTAQLIQDALLAEGVYSSNNKNTTPTINGSQPIELSWSDDYKDFVPTTFGAQLYKNVDGSCTIAFRGTEGNFADWAANGAYVTNQWHPEWEAATRFTAMALAEIRREDPTLTLDTARDLLRVTGHSQGGFLVELQARLYGLKGSSLDGMGAEGLYNEHRGALMAKAAEQGVALADGYPVVDFKSRIYTAIGLMGRHSTDDVEYSPLYSMSALLIGLGAGPAASALFQGLVHGIGNIVEIEKARAENAFLRLITHDDTSGTLGLEAARLSEGLVGGPVLVAGNGTLVGLNEANLPLTEELRDALVTFGAGTAIFRQSDGAVYLESADGRRGLLRRTDGSGFEWQPDASGNATITLVRGPGGVQTRRVEARVSEVEVSDMGGSVERRSFEIGSNGLSRLTGVATSGYVGSTHVTVTRDGVGAVVTTRRVAMDGEGNFVDHTVRQDGSETRIVRDVHGFEVKRVEVPSYAQTLASGIQDATSLINAIKSGKPLPQLASGLKVLNTLDREHALPYLGMASTVAQGVQSQDLEASSDGTRVSMVPEGIRVEFSNGQATVFVTNVLDLGAANDSAWRLTA